MEGPIQDITTNAVDILLVCLILSGALALFGLAMQINGHLLEQQAQAARLEEYRKHNCYDNKDVYAQDVISAILINRGYPTVYVSSSSKGSYTYSLTQNNGGYSATLVSNKIDLTTIYHAELVYRDNVNKKGEVVAYRFTAK